MSEHGETDDDVDEVSEFISNQEAYCKQLNSALVNYKKANAQKKASRHFLLSRLENINELFKKIVKCDLRINSFTGDKIDNYKKLDQFTQMDDLYHNFKSDLLDAIDAIEPLQSHVIANPNPNPNPNNQQEDNLNHHMRLPTINIPTFNGEYHSWPSFKNSFQQLVAENTSLNNIQKLHYLKNSVSGDAKNLIQNYDIVDANYLSAWKKLKLRFDNQRVLVSSHLKTLFNQPSAQKESANQLRQLIDTSTNCLDGLKTLRVPTENWDPLVIHIITEKMASTSHSLWESTLTSNNDLPKLDDLLQFLENRFRALEAIANKPAHHSADSSISSIKGKHHKSFALVTKPSIKCQLCNQDHYIRHCASFLSNNPQERLKIVQSHSLCTNCLVPGHSATQCRNRSNCFKCRKRHNTLLHIDQNNTNDLINFSNTQTAIPSTSSSTTATVHLSQLNKNKQTFNTVLLATALVTLTNPHGLSITLRALIDSGSQVSFITANAAKLLQLKSMPTNTSLFGIGQTHAGNAMRITSAILSSTTYAEFTLYSDFLIIPEITGPLPNSSFIFKSWPHIQNLALADPQFHEAKNIDILLGADIYGQIIRPGIHKGNISEPIAQHTTLGWILFGGTQQKPNSTNSNNYHISLHTCLDIDHRLRSFWEYEEVFQPILLNTEEQKCEKHFVTNYRRDENGRFTVQLPFKHETPPTMGYSKSNAVVRLHQMERKFSRNPQLASEYSTFMAEYEALGHMRKAVDKPDAYFIPHHAVLKASSSTTKLRVVFDASRKSSSGSSLNDHLMIGPTIQDELTSIITRWRKYPIAFSSDIEKMYRQIKIDERDLDYQRIVWRSSTYDPIQEYQLLTVTYGTASSQYLAIRSLHQLAQDNAELYPVASEKILQDFYVDDLLSGAYNISAALELQDHLRKISASGGFNLRKWSSNCEQLLQAVPDRDRETKSVHIIEFDKTIKSLGIYWNPVEDKFTFQTFISEIPTLLTKRNILSDISKQFDPLGWICPLIVRAKIFIQQLWLLNLDWDDEIPSNQCKEWIAIRSSLHTASEIKIPRSISHHLNHSIELHGFSDASIHAYAAVVYTRSSQPDGTYTINIISAKTRVAPVRQLSIAKLELAGAHLLSKLLSKVKSDLKIPINQTTAWTDSSIVLQWMKCHPNKLQTYVANRISDILNNKDICHWRHIPGSQNPADCASRGAEASLLKNHPLWWTGPPWLHQPVHNWPISTPEFSDEIPELKTSALTTSVQENELLDFIQSFSSLTHLTRIFALVLRFVHNIKNRKDRHTGIISLNELNASLNKCISLVQQSEFYAEFNNLKKCRQISASSHLKSLNPILSENLIRVGGRLQHSNLSHNEKHPIILPKSHHLTKIIINFTHLQTLHGGVQLVITTLRLKYWIISMRSSVRNEIHKCITCFRFAAQRSTQLMGNLPKPRITIDRAFTNTGVDCAGPIDIRMSKGRGAKSYKGYITLFICLSTKAIHIEVVSEMSTAAFLAAYRRFVSRRGTPANMYSDNGTNFVGASKIIKKTTMLHLSIEIINELSINGTQWHFIPASAPHFGGLWEAGIKSMKQHLKRIIGNNTLTFEELTTLLYQIEQCLNSRPLCPVTSDPSDLSILTPGHFLIGNSLLAPPDNPNEFENTNILSRWHLVQRLYHNFWKRWQHEYLVRLQQRPKWQSQTNNIKIDDLVIIIEDNLPPSRWILGRVVDTHPGTDGLVRVVTIKCKNSTVKRPISKIALLPN